MNCTKCGKKTKVIDSRTTQKRGVKRRRECVRCKHRFTTHEMVDRNYE